MTATLTEAREKTHWRVILALLLVMIPAVLLRYRQTHIQTPWLDELYSFELSAGRGYEHDKLPINTILHPKASLTSLVDAQPVSRVWAKQAYDSHPPLYFVTLRIWREIFGDSETAGRWLSITFSLIGIVLLFQITRRLFGFRPAIGAALIMAIAPAQIRYGVEIRPYAMSQTLCLFGALLLINIEARGLNFIRGVFFVAAILAMELTHYLAFGVAIGLFIYSFVRVRKAIALFPIAAVLFALIWGKSVIQMTHESHALFDWVIGIDPPRLTLMRVALMPLTLLADTGRHISPAALAAILIYFLPLLLLRRKKNLLLPTLWLWCGVGLLATMDLVRHTLMLRFVRYALVAAPGLYMLYASLGRLLAVAAMIFCVISLPTLNELEHENWKEPSQWIASRPSDDSLIILLTHPRDWESSAMVMYLGVNHHLPHRDYLLLHDEIPPQVLAQVRKYKNLYVFCQSSTYPLEKMLPGYRAVDGQRLEYFGTVTRLVKEQ